MLLQAVAEASAQVAGTPARGTKTETIAAVLAEADATELPIVVSWLSGALPQRQIGVGWAALRDVPDPVDTPALTVTQVHSRFDLIKQSTGPGSAQRRRELLAGLFGEATAVEQAFLRQLLGGELRQGAQIGVMTDAVSRAATLLGQPVPPADVRRAAMLSGDLSAVALVARDGRSALAAIGLRVGRPVGPMLAQTATSTDDALARLGGHAAVEWKLDGARVQVHRDGQDVLVVTRTLDDITARVPELVAAVRALPAERLVLDGEVLAVRPDGRPAPFQMTASRFGTRRAATPDDVPLRPYFFDILHLDGRDLLDGPGSVRARHLADAVPESLRVPRLVTSDPAAAAAFLDGALQAGHEGVVVKSLDAPYEAGRRGAGWLKVKPVHTLDLVVLAVEWGSGRRTGWLSNIHLGARAADGGLVMLGKTFKGMTDEMLRWQTRRFTELAVGPTGGYVVPLRPEQVVEIAFDGVQRSTRYPGGVALRFARVLRYRDDKPVEEIDTLDTVRGLLIG